MIKRKSKNKKPRAQEFENEPTPERLRQAAGQVDQFKTDSGRKTKRLGSILDLMLSRGVIENHLYQAGMTAYNQWYQGGLAPVGAIDLSRERVDGGTGDPMQRRLDKCQKIQRGHGVPRCGPQAGL